MQFTQPPLETCLTHFEKLYRYIWELKGLPFSEDELEHTREYVVKTWQGDNPNYSIVGDNRCCMLYGWESGFELLYISDIWVEPQHRRQGLATALIHYAIEKQRSMDTDAITVLYVLKNNLPAMKLYQKLGFKKRLLGEDKYGFEMVYQPSLSNNL